jgi:beta-phosphoglucomutase-like phosphatase (HAD superfamily)
MEIRGLGPSQAPQEYQKQIQQASPQPQAKTPAQDSVQISQEARQLLQQERRDRLMPGTEDLIARLADRLLSAGLASADEAVGLSRKVAEALAATTKQDAEKDLEVIREKVRSGFYSDPKVIERVAERLLGELGL